MWFPRSLVFRFVCAVLLCYWLLLVVATHLPHPELPHAFDFHDKVLHVMAYGVLAGLAYGAYRLAVGSGRVRLMGLVGLGALLAIHGALDEITQTYFGRQADVADWLADVLGICVALPLADLGVRLLKRGAFLVRGLAGEASASS